MKIAICDDEKEVQAQIRDLIIQEDSNSYIEEFSSGEELLASPERYQLVFLDIQMSGISGIDAARKLRSDNKALSIVFITGAKEYVFDAFDVGALHYLLKPIDSGKFREVFERAKGECQKYDALKKTQILIRTRQNTVTLEKDEILYAESQLKKLVIHTKDRAIEYYGKINSLEGELGDTFYRCHRGYLVNMAHIAGYDGGSITLTSGETIYLAKERYAGFVKSYMRYLKNGGVCFV